MTQGRALSSQEIRDGMERGALLAIARDGFFYLLTAELVDGRSVRAMRKTGEVGEMSVDDLQRTWLRFYGHKNWEQS